MRAPLAGALVALAVACAVVAGSARADNGVSSETPAQILAQVKQAVAGAKSVHVFGTGVSGGSKIALDLKLVKGKGGAGHLAEGGIAFDIIRIGNVAYFRGDKTFWGHFTKSGLAQLFAGKWLRASATKGDLATFTPLTDIGALIDEILAQHGTLAKGATTTIAGHKAVALTDTSQGGTLYVAADGPAYPLLLKSSKTSGGQVTFTNWDKPVALAKPAKSISYH